MITGGEPPPFFSPDTTKRRTITMCLIAIKTRGAHLSEDEIRYDYSRNPHGAGFMYAKNGLVHWEKGFFNVEKLIKRWNKVVSDDMVAILHTRIATHGSHSTALCHPFPLDGSDLFRSSGSAPLVMMHNGIIPDHAWIQWNTPADSDTSAYARKLTPILKGDLPDANTVKAIEDESGWSRFVFLRGDGEFVTTSQWYDHKGILFSNSGFLGDKRPQNTRTYTPSPYSGTWFPKPNPASPSFWEDGYEDEAEKYKNLFCEYDID